MSNETQSAGGVVQNPEGHVLVVSQRGTSWSLPKGHIEEGEDLLAAAKREIHEESGVSEIEFIKPLGNYWRYKIGKEGGEDRSEKKHLYFFHFHTAQQELIPQDEHNPEARWLPKEAVADLLTAPEDKAFFLSILNQLN